MPLTTLAMPLELTSLLDLSHFRGRGLTHSDNNDNCKLDDFTEFLVLGLACFNIVFALVVLCSYLPCKVGRNATAKSTKNCFMGSVCFAAVMWIILLGVAVPLAIAEDYTNCWLFWFVLIAGIGFLLLLTIVGTWFCCCRLKSKASVAPGK